MELKEIKSGIGLGDLKFGMTRNQVKKVLGDPDEIEKFSYTDSDEDLTESWHYDKLELSLGFDEDVDWKLVTMAVSSGDYLFMNKKLIGLSREKLLETLSELGLKNLYIEDCSDEDGPGDELICSEKIGINFWMEDGKLSEVQWGPEYIDEETIRWPE
jgi:hypothetical protein